MRVLKFKVGFFMLCVLLVTGCDELSPNPTITSNGLFKQASSLQDCSGSEAGSSLQSTNLIPSLLGPISIPRLYDTISYYYKYELTQNSTFVISRFEKVVPNEGETEITELWS